MTLTTARTMFTAEVLKLRRQRPLMAFAGLLSVGVVVIFMGYLQIRHASNTTQYSAAGGIDGFRHVLRALGQYFGALAAILIGTEAGTADLSSGVFRDLVATGRSRLALFAVRVPAAIAVTLVFSAAAYAVGLVATYAFAGGGPTPSFSLVIQGAAWIALANSILAALAVGIGSLTGSRGVTLTALIGWQLVATNIILNTTSLGSVRDLLITPALGQVAPVQQGLDGVTMGTGVAVAVLAGWALLPALFGARRTVTRDA
jgi:ABC-type transport system involved in multi-copper enzyme maturation permease subunit